MMEVSLLPRLILALTLLSNLMTRYGAVEGAHNLYPGGSLMGNETIVSQNGTFELGFFNPNGTNNWYLGIWYANISETAYVWVANRASPVKNMPCVLNLTKDGQLGLFDAEGVSLWSSNGTKAVSEAVLLDSGNFVMVDPQNKYETVWESFDHPVDTWLPGMKIGGKSKLISWKNSVDPAPGIFSLEIDQSGALQFVLRWNNSFQYWESGVWDGKDFANIPEMPSSKYTYNISTENTTAGVYFKYTDPSGMNALQRFVMDKAGVLLLYTPIDGNRWSMIWSRPRDQCDVYGLCGVYGTCNSNNIQFCSCLSGFQPRDEKTWDSQEWWSSGCVRRNPLNCDAKNSSADKVKALDVGLPDSNNSHDSSYAATWNDCEKACLANCSCTAFKYMSNLCKTWRGGLLNMRSALPRNDTTVFIRLAASEFGSSPSSSRSRRNIIGGAVGATAATIVLAIFAFLFWQRRQRLRLSQRCAVSSHPFLRTFTSKEVKIVTNNFSHRLGSGEFFSIYKGFLESKAPVAVKRMESSRNGEKQLQTELATIATLKHDNLLGLVGFCYEKSEIFIVYDYMPNGSLDSYLFDQAKSQYKVLDSKTRFRIALGAAKGIAHLHRNGIVHCDVKPENILLDANFCPKLAGFGLAKVAGREFRPHLTSIRGTRGYLAPEWMSGLPITAKADVYSFGMTLLELIAGRRNAELTVESSSQFFAAWAGSQTKRGIPVHSDGDVDWKGDGEEAEMKRATVVAGWCVEEREEARPSMWQAIQILEGVMDPQTPEALRLLLDGGAKQVH